MADFDNVSLSKLTAKLNSKLAEVKNPEPQNTKGKRKLDQSADIAQPPAKKRNQPGKPNQSQNGRPNGKPNSKPHAKSDGQSKDRQPNNKTNFQSRDRQPKARPSAPSRDRQPKPQDKKYKASDSSTANVLLDEIKALGGDEDDYKLIEDIDSDDDAINNQNGSKNADKILNAELAKFAAGLGFDQVKQDSASEESDAENDEEMKEDREAGSDDEVEETRTQDPKSKTVSKPL
jgi:ribosome biogenesis protein MAK21